ncbi:hypothetical protein UMM65_01215 [Aureibaculum sp. 2210JD6-5]|uniref:DUF6984 family protein n=1 Tax=Aureibaculum sp. 2210JD6-5 TaxID=3103957 RepID=UPI002AADACDF|nr:hypothetical protein [Aureibaculum sp. 2210JD6-5]MDY7393850.1 hypothetical protein [Aureibaculum sp. 2210JD6-5]
MKPIRDLTKEEIELTTYLLSLIPEFDVEIPKKAWTMDDEEMGSISFDLEGKAEFGEVLIQAEYEDTDGVTVLITLTEDKGGNLFELDFWKTDFTKLIEYPKPEKINQENDNN